MIVKDWVSGKDIDCDKLVGYYSTDDILIAGLPAGDNKWYPIVDYNTLSDKAVPIPSGVEIISPLSDFDMEFSCGDRYVKPNKDYKIHMEFLKDKSYYSNYFYTYYYGVYYLVFVKPLYEAYNKQLMMNKGHFSGKCRVGVFRIPNDTWIPETKNEIDRIPFYSERKYQKTFRSVYVGEMKRTYKNYNYRYPGSSVLCEFGQCQYVYICIMIKSFNTLAPITEFSTPVIIGARNSRTVRSWGVDTEKNVYLFSLDNDRVLCILQVTAKILKNPYEFYNEIKKKFLEFSQIIQLYIKRDKKFQPIETKFQYEPDIETVFYDLYLISAESRKAYHTPPIYARYRNNNKIILLTKEKWMQLAKSFEEFYKLKVIKMKNIYSPGDEYKR